MPKNFENCAKGGGKVRTVKIGADRYMHVCKTNNGKWTRGEVKTKHKGKNK